MSWRIYSPNDILIRVRLAITEATNEKAFLSNILAGSLTMLKKSKNAHFLQRVSTEEVLSYGLTVLLHEIISSFCPNLSTKS